MEIIRKEKTTWDKYCRFEKKTFIVKSMIPTVENPEIIYARYSRAELDEWLSTYTEYGEIIISIEPEIAY